MANRRDGQREPGGGAGSNLEEKSRTGRRRRNKNGWLGSRYSVRSTQLKKKKKGQDSNVKHQSESSSKSDNPARSPLSCLHRTRQARLTCSSASKFNSRCVHPQLLQGALSAQWQSSTIEKHQKAKKKREGSAGDNASCRPRHVLLGGGGI